MMMRDDQGLHTAASDQIQKVRTRRKVFALLQWLAGDEERSFHLLAVSLLFFGSLEVLTIGLSLCHVKISQLIAIAIILGSVCVAYWYWRFLSRDRSRKLIRGENKVIPGWPVCVFVFLAAIIYFMLWLLAYALPDFAWDSLWDHNPTMHFWALKGYVHWIKVDPCHFWDFHISAWWNGLPKVVEMFGFIMVRATGLNRLLNAVNLPFFPLAVLAIVSLSRILGASSKFALLAGSLYMFIPINVAQSVTTYIDASVASFYIALFAMTAYTLKGIRSGLMPWKIMPALGCSLGLAISSKGTGIVLLPLVGALLAIRVFLVDRQMRLSRATTSVAPTDDGDASEFKPIRYPPAKFLRKGILFITITIGIAIAVGGYWHIRNYIHMGNPVHPVRLIIAWHTIFPSVSIETPFCRPPYRPETREWLQAKRIIHNWLDGFVMNIVRGPIRLGDPYEVLHPWKDAICSYSSWYGGLGLLWLVGCVPLILFLLAYVISKQEGSWLGRHSNGQPNRGIFLSLLAITVVLFFAMPKNHNHIARYTIWLYGLGLPCFAVVAESAWKSKLHVNRLLGRIWIGLCVILIVSEGLYSFLSQTTRIAIFQTGEENTISLPLIVRSLREKYPVDYTWPRLRGSIFETILAGNAPVALCDIRGKYYERILGHLTQQQSFGKRKIFFLEVNSWKDTDDYADFLRERNIRYVICDNGLLIPRELAKLAIAWDTIPGRFNVLTIDPENLPEG